WPRPVRILQTIAAPAAAAIIGIEIQAPMRNRLSKIGSEPMNVILPPVSLDDKPISFMSSLNAAEMSSSSAAVLFGSTAFLAIANPPTLAHALSGAHSQHRHLLMGSSPPL